MLRKTVHFSGAVQGVGFRYTTQRLARGFEVTGYVRNLPDGRVELVAEGPTEQINGLVQAVQRAFHSCIHDLVALESPATREFHRFDIAF
ncbi:MAG: acylphosphatase [Planctomycetota bacterium]